MEVISPEYSNNLEEDYKYGALNILWYRDDKKRFLVFASIELYPNEHPKPIRIQEENHQVGNKGRKYFYFRREVMLARKLIEIYTDLAQSSKQLTTFWQKNEETFEPSVFCLNHNTQLCPLFLPRHIYPIFQGVFAQIFYLIDILQKNWKIFVWKTLTLFG